MSVKADVSGLQTQQLVELFVWDDRAVGGSQVLYWHAGTSGTDQPIWWQGVRYEPFPIEAEGFEQSSTGGSLPRPTLRASNIGGFLGAYVRAMRDALGAKLTRRRTLGKYLDARNYTAGNPTADPNAGFPDDIFYVARKKNENAIFIEMELAVKFDVAGIKLPRRQVIAGTCQWVYRSPECTYAGPPVQDINGNFTADFKLDQCRKTLDACKARFGQTGVLPTSAFPASLLAQYQ